MSLEEILRWIRGNEALLSGIADAVINQDAGHEVRSSVRLAMASLNGDRLIESQERIRVEIFLRDNMS